MALKENTDYKVDKLLEKVHEIHIMVTQLQQLDRRMEFAEKKIETLEARVMKLALTVIITVTGGATAVGPELVKFVKALLW